MWPLSDCNVTWQYIGTQIAPFLVECDKVMANDVIVAHGYGFKYQ